MRSKNSCSPRLCLFIPLKVLYLTYPSNSTRFLKETLHLQTSLCFVLVSRTLLVPGWLLHCCMTPPRVPWDTPRLCSWLSVFCIIYHEGNCLKCWPLAWTFLSIFFFFFFLSKARRASCIIYQHFLGGHTFFSLLSGLTQLPSVLLFRGPPVLDNTLHCYMKKNELWRESEILSPSIVCPVSCVLLIAASLYIHACKLPLLSFIQRKSLVNNVHYLLIAPWILDKHRQGGFRKHVVYTQENKRSCFSLVGKLYI